MSGGRLQIRVLLVTWPNGWGGGYIEFDGGRRRVGDESQVVFLAHIVDDFSSEDAGDERRAAVLRHQGGLHLVVPLEEHVIGQELVTVAVTNRSCHAAAVCGADTHAYEVDKVKTFDTCRGMSERNAVESDEGLTVFAVPIRKKVWSVEIGA